MEFDILPFTSSDIEDGHGLTQQLGWPHTLDDWMFAAGAGSGYTVRHEGDLLGTCLTWRMDHSTATLGLLVVAPSAQKRGLGRALLRRSLRDHPKQAILLHATTVAIPLYLSEGFSPGGWINQIQGSVCASGTETWTVGESIQQHPIRTLQISDLDTILSLDSHATGVDRSDLLTAVFDVSEGVAVDHGGEVSGFALCRAFGHGAVIGPVVGSSPDTAHAMVQHLLTERNGRFVRIDAVDGGIETDWLAQFGLHEVDRVRVMTRGDWPTTTSVSPHKFALIGHAFG